MSGSPDERILDIAQALGEVGLIAQGEQLAVSSLSGGVSCDVFLVEAKGRSPVVVKRALPKLRVEADWQAPVERAETEVEWLRLAAEIDSRIVPAVIAQDRKRHLFVMAHLPKPLYPVWKDELASGAVDLVFAASVGAWMSQIHSSTANSPSIARQFADKRQFYALRLEPYLLHAAAANPEVSAQLLAAVNEVARSQIALMQGDVSPKNILHGKDTPVFLDAETACYGDPAFDLAFCLNHLLLKCVWHPQHTDLYAAAFVALKEAYMAGVNWEAPDGIERRAVRLLSGLLLARIDGKSPVEYIDDARDKGFVRRQAKAFLAAPRENLSAMLSDWVRAARGYFTVSGTR
jgi:5-methylthioribose kinase